MLRRIFAGASAVTLALALTQCAYEDSAPVSSSREKEMVGKPSFLVGSAFAWRFTQQEGVQGTEKVAMIKAITDPQLSNELYLVRRNGNRLQQMFFIEDEGILSPPFDIAGPANVNGTPTVAIATAGPDSGRTFIAYKTTEGKIDVWRRQTGDVIATLTPGSSSFGNPSLVFNTPTYTIELMHREGARIRHWTLNLDYSNSYTVKSYLVPCTGGSGTSVISAVSLAQNADGKLVVAARIRDRSSGGVTYGRLRHWSTSGATRPFTWTTGNIFGQEDASTEAPSLAPTGEGSVLAVARIRAIADTPELAQYEIRNNRATQLSIFTAGYSQPVITRMETNRLYMMTLNVSAGRVQLALGTR